MNIIGSLGKAVKKCFVVTFVLKKGIKRDVSGLLGKKLLATSNVDKSLSVAQVDKEL